MVTSEPINCLTAEDVPMVFRWQGVLYEVTGVIRSWFADDEWWNSCYFADSKYWLVEVKNSTGRYELRHDPDGRWWILRDRAVASTAA
jgi:hypothetical protein